MNRMLIIFIVYVSVLNNFGKTYNKSPWEVPIPLSLVDRDTKDLFFDRIIFISMNKDNYTGDGTQQKHISLGVFIDNERLLTSYNPFAELIKDAKELDDIRACFITARQVMPENHITYQYECLKIKCGRPLIPNIDLKPEQWHDIDKKHTSLHDLMVLRVDNPVTFWTPERELTFDELYTSHVIQSGNYLTAGPSLTTFAIEDEEMESTFKFASIGLYSVQESERYVNLESTEFEETDNVLVNCDEWLPRYWGYFICLLNHNKFKGFSSGAMLFSNKSLFGIGSFTIWRGKASILVFTDVRPYTEHINYTCTDIDLKL